MAKSLTHEHILSVLNTECERYACSRTIRVLDAGCGDGHLVAYLQRNLPILRPSLKYEVYGFDVCDHGVQKQGFLNETVHRLSNLLPEIDWNDRISLISGEQNWPYEDQFFDIVVSNQVLEHVGNHDFFLSELFRVLGWGGFSVHVFPLQNCIMEGHLNLVWAHRIRTHDSLVRYIKIMSALRLGKYASQFKTSGTGLGTYAEQHADYVWYWTNYISCKDLFRLIRKNHLRGSFRYSWEYYERKLRTLIHLRNKPFYRQNRPLFQDSAVARLLSYVSSITLFLEKKETYKGH